MAYSPDQPDFTMPTLGPISKESRLEWHSILSNNGVATNQLNVTGDNRKGKFIPRGARGFIDNIEVYCMDTGLAGGLITVNLMPFIGLNTIYTANIVVPPGGVLAWRVVDFNIMWSYDSLFISLVGNTAFMAFTYDVTNPTDAWTSTDGGLTWDFENRRYHIRITFKAETTGDVPVSGTINTIPIPTAASRTVGGLVNVPDAAWTDIITVYGTGTLVEARLEFASAAVPAWLVIFGLGLTTEIGVCYDIINQHYTMTAGGTSGKNDVGEFYQLVPQELTRIHYRGKIEFRQFLTLRAFQSTGAAVNTSGNLYVKVIR